MTDQETGGRREHEGARDHREQRAVNGTEMPGSGLESPRDPPQRRLGDLDDQLEAQAYPATGAELVRAVGDGTVQSKGGTRRVEDLLAPFEGATFDSADEVRGLVLDRLSRR